MYTSSAYLSRPEENQPILYYSSSFDIFSKIFIQFLILLFCEVLPPNPFEIDNIILFTLDWKRSPSILLIDFGIWSLILLRIVSSLSSLLASDLFLCSRDLLTILEELKDWLIFSISNIAYRSRRAVNSLASWLVPPFDTYKVQQLYAWFCGAK